MGFRRGVSTIPKLAHALAIKLVSLLVLACVMMRHGSVGFKPQAADRHVALDPLRVIVFVVRR